MEIPLSSLLGGVQKGEKLFFACVFFSSSSSSTALLCLRSLHFFSRHYSRWNVVEELEVNDSSF